MKAVKGKRKKPGASAFFANLERELLRLETELNEGLYRPGRYVEIEVLEPKRRLVSAAPFRDRVVRHALCAVVQPIFERGFIAHSYANRSGKGTHKAIAAYERYRDRHAYVLRCDLFRYFPSIDHQILKAEFRRRIACKRKLWLMDRIVDGSNAQEPVATASGACLTASGPVLTRRPPLKGVYEPGKLMLRMATHGACATRSCTATRSPAASVLPLCG